MTLGEPCAAPDEFRVVTLCASMRFREELDADARARLRRIHQQKVAMADEVLVVNVGGYVGGSTCREIEHARSRGLAVNFLESAGQGSATNCPRKARADAVSRR